MKIKGSKIKSRRQKKVQRNYLKTWKQNVTNFKVRISASQKGYDPCWWKKNNLRSYTKTH